MQIIANYADLGQITAIIRKKNLLTIQPEILLLPSSLLLFTYNKAPDFYIAEYWLQSEKTNIKTVSLKHYQIANTKHAFGCDQLSKW